MQQQEAQPKGTTVGQSLPGLHARRTAATQAAFLVRHLRPGMRLVDCGCGPGTITIGLAGVVAPGEVVGVDLDAKRVAEATRTAAEQGVANVRFEEANVYELPFPDEMFDAVYENAMLMHVDDAARAVREMWRVLKPGGVIGLRDVNLDGHLFTNANEGMLESHPLVRAWHVHRGIDMHLGARVSTLLRDAGFLGIEGSASYDSYGTREAVGQAAEQMARRIETVVADLAVEQGTADKAAIARMAQAWRAWAEDPDAFWGGAHGEAVGWK